MNEESQSARLMSELIQATQANDKLTRIIENMRPVDLRDQFAMAALTGLMSATNSDGEWTHVVKYAVKTSYETADEMLKAREGKL